MIKITEDNYKQYELTENFEENIEIYCEFTAPKLAEVSGYVYVRENAAFTAPKLAEVRGSVYVNQNAAFTAPKLAEVRGSVYVNQNAAMEKILWKNLSKVKWYITEYSSDWLIRKNGNFIYKLRNVEFTREWFLKIKNDELTPDEVFAIDNVEHRRIAYEFMDKAKMKQLKDFKILDKVEDDGYGNKMEVWSFTVQKMTEPLKFFNCFCPSTKREYFIQTDKDTCWEAKARQFGLEGKDVVWVKEW
jgi:hypothetical protein